MAKEPRKICDNIGWQIALVKSAMSVDKRSQLSVAVITVEYVDRYSVLDAAMSMLRVICSV